jgi:hypothetical protein
MNAGRVAGHAALLASPSLQRALLLACFTGDTPLLTPEGSKRIDQFQVGDLVLSRDEHDPDSPVLPKVVEEVFVRTGRILHLHVGGRIIKTTPEHPLYVRDRGWIAAAELAVGDLLCGHDGRLIVLDDVLDTGEHETVYNLHICDFHTYFVGAEEWGFSVWAHNSYKLISQGNPADSPRDRYVGATARQRQGSRESRTYKAVVKQMESDGRIVYDIKTKKPQLVVTAPETRVNSFHPLDGGGIDMSHTRDAVRWWNQEGRFYGAKSREVRQFMLDPKNYTLELSGRNRARGGALGHEERFLPPAWASLTVIDLP